MRLLFSLLLLFFVRYSVIAQVLDVDVILDSIWLYVEEDYDKTVELYEKFSSVFSGSDSLAYYLLNAKHASASFWHQYEDLELELEAREDIIARLDLDSSKYLENIAYAKLWKADYFNRVGKYHLSEKACYWILDTLSVSETTLGSHRTAYLYLGQAAKHRGMQERAIHYYNRAIALENNYSEKFGVAPIVIPTKGRLAGALVKQGKIGKALPLLREGVAYYNQKVQESDRPKEYARFYIQQLRALAEAQMELGDLDSAHYNLDICLEIEEELDRPRHWTLISLARLYLRSNLLSEAKEVLRQAFPYFEPNENRLRSEAFLLLGEIQEAEDSTVLAFNSYELAYQYGIGDVSGMDLSSESININAFQALTAMVSLKIAEDLTEAKALFGKAMAAIDHISASRVVLEDQVAILDQGYLLYELGLNIAERLADTELALEIMLKSKMHVLQRELVQTRSLQGSEKIVGLEELRRKKAIVDKHLLQEEDSGNILRLTERRTFYQNQINRFLAELDFENDNFSIGRDISLIESNSVTVYFYGQNHIYFVASNGHEDLRLGKLGISPDELRDAISLLREAVESRDTVTHLIASIQEVLMSSISSGPNLSLFLDGPLLALPLELLPQLHSVNISYCTAPEHLKNHQKKLVEKAVAYAPFNKSSAENAYVVRSSISQDLPQSKNEVSTIASITGGEYYLDSNCVSRKIFADDDPDLMHFATHAVANLSEPENSHLLLYGEEPLYSFQVGVLDLSAEMITLSACQTSMGKVIKGEGSLSLARSFFRAGAKSVIASLWAVDDKSTSDIMVYFYKHLKEGKRKDAALRLAKKDYLATAGPLERHPYYWAGFIAIGDMSPLDFGDNFNWIFWLFVVTVIGLLGTLMLKKGMRAS